MIYVRALICFRHLCDWHLKFLSSIFAHNARRNCRGNPFCLNALGEKRWFEDLDESRWNDFDPESERRPEVRVDLKSCCCSSRGLYFISFFLSFSLNQSVLIVFETMYFCQTKLNETSVLPVQLVYCNDSFCLDRS